MEPTVEPTVEPTEKPHQHKEVKISGKAATCTVSGLTEGSKCADCGKILKKQKTIKALGHKWSSWKVKKKPTTQSAGEQTRTCSRCKKIETKAIAKLERANQTLIVKAKKPSVKASKLKKKKQTIKKAKAFNITGAQGTMAFKKVSGNKQLMISKKGNITVKKGTKKGTYRIKVLVTAAGNENYKAGSKTITVKVKVT